MSTAATCSTCRSTRWAGSCSTFVDSAGHHPGRRRAARPPCWPASSGMRSASPTTGKRCWPPGSTSSAACCCTARRAPARRTPPATWSGQMAGYTRLVLTGRSLVAVGAITDLARDLLPAVVVLEDVDLVAEERSLRPGIQPGAVRPARRHGRRSARRRPAVPAHHQPRRPARTGAGRAARAASTSPSRSTLPDARARRRLLRCTASTCRCA